jgi:rhodanese-related sulfurtransferase
VNATQILTRALALIAAAALLAAGANLIRSESSKLAWIGSYSTPAAVAVAGVSAAPARDPGALFTPVTGDIAERLHQEGALFIDARRSADFAEGHIPGARGIPVWEHDVDARVAALASEKVPFDRVIVIYCSGPACKDSEMLAEKLTMAGYFNIYTYTAGFPGWTRRGGEVKTGAAH